jgi:hypothetical protein
VDTAARPARAASGVYAGGVDREARVRRSTKLLIALVTLGVALTPVAVSVFFTGGSTVSSSGRPSVTKVWIPLRPKPPSAVELRAFLRANGGHSTRCTARWPTMVCVLAHGAGRCEQDSGGHGSCTFRARKKSLSEEMIWVTNISSDTVTVTSSAPFS